MGWNSQWFAPELGAARFDYETQQLAAVSRAPGNLDLFAIGFDDRMWTAFWSGLSPSLTLRAISVPDEGRAVEVSGKMFTANGPVKIAYDISTGGAPEYTSS